MPRLIDVFLLRILFAAALLLGGGHALADSYEDSLAAARSGDTAALVKLLERGIDPDTIDTESNSLLILAAREGHAETVAALLRFKPKMAYRNLGGDTALMLAALKGNAGVVEVLIKGGAPLDHEGWTPLMYAAFEGHLDIVERLLVAGADVNALAPNRANALMLAARNGHIEVVRRLLKTDVDLEQQTDRGLTADAWAESNANTDIAGLIRAARAKSPQQGKAIRIEIK